MFFLWDIVAVTVLPRLFALNVPVQPSSVLLIALIGSVIALPVGGLVGLLFALIDVAMVWVAHRIEN